ncbi:hypothetical protein GTY44_11620 [Streptomyces sp. SID5914]|nr:hypothetical protein [Streptomyces sp. SID5914]
MWTQSGDATVNATAQEDLVVLALLGRLYPENLTLRPADHATARSAGCSAARTPTDGTGPGRLTLLVDPAQAH